MRPFVLQPVLVERPWGGRRLDRYGKRLPAGFMIGESWEVADLPDHVAPHVHDPRSRVAAGSLAGAALSDLIATSADALLGPVAPTEEGRFPLLVKLLDAREHLSVQVHPHAAYVAEHPDARLKTESWYVMEAEPDAELFLDVRDGVGRQDVVDVMGTSGIAPLLRSVPAVPGAFHHVPAGLIHALGSGVMVAEVQTPSDTTFRIYDWAEEYGREPRPLHAEESAASIVVRPPDAFSSNVQPDVATRRLIDTDYYWMVEHRSEGGPIRLASDPGPRVMMVIAGWVTIGRVEAGSGMTVVIPASAMPCPVEATDDAILLEVGLPVH
jgi:mannose-6-phosphate isomerase